MKHKNEIGTTNQVQPQHQHYYFLLSFLLLFVVS